MVADEGHSIVGQLRRPSMTPVKMPHVNISRHFAAFSSRLRLVAYNDNHRLGGRGPTLPIMQACESLGTFSRLLISSH